MITNVLPHHWLYKILAQYVGNRGASPDPTKKPLAVKIAPRLKDGFQGHDLWGLIQDEKLPLPTSSSFLLRSEQWVFFWCLLIWSKTVPETGTTSRLPLMRFHSRSWPWSRKKPLTMANPPRSWNPHATKVEGIQQHLWLWEHEPEGRVRLDAFGFSSVAQSSFLSLQLNVDFVCIL